METEFNQPGFLYAEQPAPAGSKGDNSMHRFFIRRLFGGIVLLIAISGSMLSQAPSARDVLVRFCDLDSQGEQLTPDGWQKVAALFVSPGAPRHDKITVVRDFVVSRPALKKGNAEFYVEYIQLGRIDPSQARFSPLPPMKVRAGFNVIRQSAAGSGGALSHAGGPAEWRIAESVPEPHLTVDTAIRFATKLHANARDVAIRGNADKMLAALKRFR
jgi:hypothetical protein